MRHQLKTNEVKSQKFLSSCKKSMNQLTATIFQHAKSAIKPTTQTLGYKGKQEHKAGPCWRTRQWHASTARGTRLTKVWHSAGPLGIVYLALVTNQMKSAVQMHNFSIPYFGSYCWKKKWPFQSQRSSHGADNQTVVWFMNQSSVRDRVTCSKQQE